MSIKKLEDKFSRPVAWNSRTRILLLLFLLLSIIPSRPSSAQSAITPDALAPTALITTSTARVQPAVQEWIAQNPGKPVRVIVQSTGETAPLTAFVTELGGLIIHDLSIIHAVAVEVPATDITALAARPDVRWVSLDAQVVSTAAKAAKPTKTPEPTPTPAPSATPAPTATSTPTAQTVNTFPDTTNTRAAWDQGLNGTGVGVVVIDSGVEMSFNFSNLNWRLNFSANSQSINDNYGHGTHVAGIIANNGSTSNGLYKGIAPNARLYSMKIAGDDGKAYESDTVAALQWVYQNRIAYNLRVVNLSINSLVPSSYHQSALNAAAEILWFNGVVVVTSAGNFVPGSNVNPIHAAPANDPFFITVGASYEQGTTNPNDDIVAPFSAYGTTLDGHVKPDIIAPGTDIISVLSSRSAWNTAYPTRVMNGGGFFRLSGTSMSAPMVTGAVALLLQDEPHLTPDQVKYRLTHTPRVIAGNVIYETDPYVPMADVAQVAEAVEVASVQAVDPNLIIEPGLPVIQYYKYLDVTAAVNGTSTESSNTGLVASQLLWSGDSPINWNSVNWNSVNWNSVNWNSVNWNSVNWNSVNWNSATVTEISQYLNSGTLPADMVWETPVWSHPDAPRQTYRLMIPSIEK